MQSKTLCFGQPLDVTPAFKDGKVFRFPFTAVDTDLIGQPEESQKTSAHVINVNISRHRIISWSVADASLEKVLFEIAKREMQKVFSQTGVLPTEHEVLILTTTHSKECPFDPDRIQSPVAATVELRADRQIGFRA